MREKTPWIIIGALMAFLVVAVLSDPAEAAKFRGTTTDQYRPDDDLVWKGTVDDTGIILDCASHPEGGSKVFLRGVAVRNTSLGGPSTDVLFGDLSATDVSEVTTTDWEVYQQAERGFEFFGTTLGLKAPAGRTIGYEVVGLR